jgi:GNAT superfamily N-acetyltransferase
LTTSYWSALADLLDQGGPAGRCWCVAPMGIDYRRRPVASNRADLEKAVKQGPPPGLLALRDQVAVGWCRVTPRDAVPGLERAFRTRCVDDVPVWSISCFYIHKGHRRKGIMTALISAAIEYARAAGAPALEAYPLTARCHRARPAPATHPPSPWPGSPRLPGARRKDQSCAFNSNANADDSPTGTRSNRHPGANSRIAVTMRTENLLPISSIQPGGGVITKMNNFEAASFLNAPPLMHSPSQHRENSVRPVDVDSGDREVPARYDQEQAVGQHTPTAVTSCHHRGRDRSQRQGPRTRARHRWRRRRASRSRVVPRCWMRQTAALPRRCRCQRCGQSRRREISQPISDIPTDEAVASVQDGWYGT